MFFTDSLKRYFLRTFAIQSARPNPMMPGSAFNTATFRTALLVGIVGAGVFNTAALIFYRFAGDGRLANVFSDRYSWANMVAGAITLGVSWLIVRRWFRDYRDNPRAAAEFDTPNDLIISWFQFFAFFLVGAGLPIAVYAILTLIER